MDEVIAKMVRVSAEGLTYVGHISVANRIGARGAFKPKARARCRVLPCNAVPVTSLHAMQSLSRPCMQCSPCHALLRPSCFPWQAACSAVAHAGRRWTTCHATCRQTWHWGWPRGLWPAQKPAFMLSWLPT